jgi:hypothetical protein
MPKKTDKKGKRKLHSLEKTLLKHSKKTFFDYPPNSMLIIPNMDEKHTGLHGGRFNFGKAISRGFKHVGHVLAPIAKSVGNEAKNYAVDLGNKIKSEGKTIANNAINQGKTALINHLQSSLPSLAESAPMLGETALMAAGKPKRKRAVSAKMAKRGALIKKLMHEHSMTLPQASKYIKQHSLI